MPEITKGNVNPVRGHVQKTQAEAGKHKTSNGVKKALPAIVLVTTFYYSFLLAIGLFLGYLGCKVYYNKFVATGKVDKIFLDCGKWKIHLHHWIMGAIVLALVWVVDLFYLPKFFVGVVGGIMAHDIYDFNDWYQIVLKNDSKEKTKEITK